MRKKTSTIMAWLVVASVIVTSLSAGTVTESAEEFGDSSDSIADIAEEGNVEAKEKGLSDSIMLCSLTLFMCDEIFKL